MPDLSGLFGAIGSRPPSSDRREGDGFHLLLVEDRPEWGRLVEELLSDGPLGVCDLRRAETLAEAMDDVSSHPLPDAILLDLNLPDSRGLESVRAMVDAAPEVPIVVLTGVGETDTAVAAVREGAQDYLVKGEVEPRHLAMALRHARERGRHEREVRRRERAFSALISHVSDIVTVVAPDGTILFQSPSVERVLGHPPEAMTGSDVARYIHPDDRDRVRRELEDLAGSPGSEQMGEARFRHADGSWRLLESRGRTPPEGTGIDGVIVVSRDVTEARAARQEAQQQREWLNRLVETTGDGILITDADGVFQYSNPAAREMLGLGPGEIEGRSYRDPAWRITAPDGGPFPDERLPVARVLDSGEAVRGVEHAVERADGVRRVISVNAAPLNDGDGDLEGVVASLRDVTEKKEFEAELEHQALHDHLTGLPNRVLFRDRLRHALERFHRSGERLAVVFLDLKRFKVVNDSLGHEAGDRVLQEVGDRLRTEVREQDTVARLGGDEFTVLLEDVDGEKEARRVARRIMDAFDRPVHLGSKQVPVEASLGVAVYPGSQVGRRPDPSEMIRWADHAMYRAKDRPGTACAMADPARQEEEEDADRLNRESRLRRALEEERIRPVYQPIVDLRTDEVRGVEALARWSEPDLGEQSPGAFIPLAEETGLIVPLGKQQLERACRDILESGLTDPDTGDLLRLHVNLSARELADPRVVDRVEAVLDRTGFPPDRLCLEITETAALREPDAVDDLNSLGADLALDDFGVRYSSLAQLRRVRVGTLKIDRTFLAGLPDDPTDRAIVESVLKLGASLSLRVVAEGVETAGQLELLRRLGCPEAQGFHIGRPGPIEDVVDAE